jgi:hypothetical protein
MRRREAARWNEEEAEAAAAAAKGSGRRRRDIGRLSILPSGSRLPSVVGVIAGQMGIFFSK